MPLLHSRGRELLGSLALVTASLGLALGAAEVVLRLALPQAFDVHPPGMYVEDSTVGYVLTPGFTSTMRRAEFRQPFTTSPVSLRGQEPRPRRGNTFRVVCLGDSFTWGFGVPDDSTFAVQLEEALGARFPDLDVQVINAGVPGYGTADQLHFLTSRADLLDPDLVIVQFLPENDFLENRTPAQGGVIVQDGWLRTRPGTAEPSRIQPAWLRAQNWLKRHSHFASFVSERLGYLAMRTGLLGEIKAMQGESFTDEDADRAVDLLRAIARLAGRRGAQSLFVFTPSQTPIVAAEPITPASARVVERAAREADAGFVDLTPLLRARSDRLRLYYRIDGHWTSMGHSAVAEILADRITTAHARRLVAARER